MLVRAVVCPHPPALIPMVSQGGAARLGDLHRVCLDAVRQLTAASADLLVCVGPARESRRWDESAGGTMRPFGPDIAFGGAEPLLPPSLTVAAYLLDAVGFDGRRSYQGVATDASAASCAAIGRAIAQLADRVALLVMGDGSAKRGKAAPGYADDRAEAFDAAVVQALAAPDEGALLALDSDLCDELWVAGRPSWQALAGAIEEDGARFAGEVAYDDAPLGVGYVVVRLTRL